MMAPILGGSSESLAPLMQPAIEFLQSLFLAPSGYSAQVIFISKNIKVLTSTFFLVVQF